MKASQPILCAALLAAVLGAVPTPGSAQILNTEVISQLSLGNDGATHDLWAENNTIYVARGEFGADVIDATDQQNPVVVHTIRPFPGVPNIDIVDVQVEDGIAYLANHVPNGSPTPHVGLFIYDVSGPGAPTELGRIEWGAGAWYHLGANAHNVYIHKDGADRYAYIASITSSAVEVFDVTNPANPVWQSSIYPPLTQYGTIPGQSHEISVQGTLCFTTWLDAGFAIHDISNPASPAVVAHVPYQGAYTYHAWPTADGQHLCTTDAWGSNGLMIWDISTPSAPQLTGSWTSGSGAIMHNVFVHGDFAYLSHFEDGMHVIDISDRSNPVQLAWYDTDPSSSGFTSHGAYGVYPFEGNIYVSHRTDGLYILGLVDEVSITSANWFRRDRELVVEATSTLAPYATLTLSGYGAMTYQSGSGTYTLTVPANRKPRTVTVTSDYGGSASERVRRRK